MAPKADRGAIYGLLRQVYRFLKYRVVFDTLLCPYGMVRHAGLLRSGNRTKSHTYTCFLRAPAQLEAVTGPTLELLVGGPQARGPLSLLLFACSNGAEAYTVASALMQSWPGLDFHIVASDHDQRLVDIAVAATYSSEEVFHSPYITEEFVRSTFDLVADRYRVKPEIRARVEFRCADVLDGSLAARFAPADLVFAQNLFFHLDPGEARTAFRNIVALLKPRAALVVEGFDLDLREHLTREHDLAPLEYRLRDIYEQARAHTSPAWWKFYYGAEPYMRWRRHRAHRYGTIFLTDTEGRG
jgi:chemotaxis protein methyltransferase CheR